MFRLFLFMLFFQFPSGLIAQLTDTNKKLLRLELSERINFLRSSLGLNELKINEVLKKAAEFHSTYQAKEDKLTHEQNKSKYATPEKRVKAFKGKEFEIIGENCLFIERKEFPLNKKDVVAIAEQMFIAWKNSPKHYENMTEPEYTFGDLGFDYCLKSNRIYATQVFGKFGIMVPNQLSKNAFGILNETKECDEFLNDYENLLLNMGNSISIEGNEVILYYHNLANFKKLFNHPNDGLAVDIIQREQLLCGQPNQLDFSQIYDGVLLKPTKADEIVANNRAKSEYRLISKVGEIPSELVDKEISTALIFIKNGKKCKYVYHCEIQKKDFDLSPFMPILYEDSTIELVNKGIVHSEIIQYSFNTSKISDTQLPVLSTTNQHVYSANLQSYSSVEGDSTHNEYLHTARAEFIQNHLQNSLNIKKSIIHSEMYENWKLMNFQLHYFSREDLLKLSHDSIRRIIASKDSTLNWENLLFEQRIATATINYSGNYATVSNQQSLEEFNFRTAIVMNNNALLNKAMYIMFKTNDFDPFILFEPQTVEYFEKNQEVIENYAALLTQHFDVNVIASTKFIHHWLQSSSKLNDSQRINLLYLYSLLGKHLIDEWDLASKQLSNVIHPLKVNVLYNNTFPEILLLNLNITFLDYFGQVNDSKNIHQTFNKIKEYIAPLSFSPKEEIKLALFYNYWSTYTSTVDYLLPKARENKLNEEALFILVETMNIVQNHYTEDDFIEINKLAKVQNSDRWCEWINKDFQLLRNYKIKRLFCDSCN